MSRSKRKTISEYIAARIMRNQMRVKFSTAHADFLQERDTNMSTPTSSTLNGDSKGQPRTPIGRPLADNPATLAAASPAKLTPDAGTSPYTVGSQVNVGPIKPVDRKTIQGSYPGDSRSSGDSAKAAMDAIANNGGPRTQMHGQQDSRNYNENGKAFQSTSNSPDSDAGN